MDMTKTTQKTQGTNDSQDTAGNPFTMDPASILEAQRKAALAGIDGLLSLQGEMHKAFETSLGRIQTETQNWTKLSNDIVAENMASSFALANKTLTTWKDEIGRFGRADA